MSWYEGGRAAEEGSTWVEGGAVFTAKGKSEGACEELPSGLLGSADQSLTVIVCHTRRTVLLDKTTLKSGDQFWVVFGFGFFFFFFFGSTGD
jgi:hypothetical protein